MAFNRNFHVGILLNLPRGALRSQLLIGALFLGVAGAIGAASAGDVAEPTSAASEEGGSAMVRIYRTSGKIEEYGKSFTVDDILHKDGYVYIRGVNDGIYAEMHPIKINEGDIVSMAPSEQRLLNDMSSSIGSRKVMAERIEVDQSRDADSNQQSAPIIDEWPRIGQNGPEPPR
jgi:hypothetical protein